MYYVDDLDEERRGAGGWVENLDEWLDVRLDACRDFEVFIPFFDIGPG